jgi:hypothetical protein
VCEVKKDREKVRSLDKLLRGTVSSDKEHKKEE